MASFTKGGGARKPFGRNQILRSAKPGSFLEKSYTISTAAHPVEAVDSEADAKILYPGEAIAKITSGANTGKFGPRQVGATDGRETLANLVGISNDFFPTQLKERDVEAAVIYQGSLVQAWCTERDATGARVALPNATADALRGLKNLQILFD